jgi:ABC-type glutathione transport system ATPase component
MATHNLSVVRYWSSYVIVIEAGRAAFHGSPQQLLSDQQLLEETGLSKVWWRVDPEYPDGEEWGIENRE